jgi:SAM-dependent methyltransferase
MSTEIQYEYFYPRYGNPRKLLPAKKFDRKIFDPINDATDRAILKKLRGPGIARYSYLKWGSLYPSPSLRCLWDDMKNEANKGEAYIDFGCGESADRFIAWRLGVRTIGMDLFPPLFTDQEKLASPFIVGDIAEPLPFADFSFSFATCHAVISLLKPSERAGFYKEAYRCMKIGGLFVLCGLNLKNGYSFDLAEERERLLKSTDFEYERGGGGGFIVRRDW